MEMKYKVAVFDMDGTILNTLQDFYDSINFALNENGFAERSLEEVRIFDVEMQTTVPDNLPRRMRYYQSMIDIDSLMKGEDYSSLKESYIIFLCTKDSLGFELPVYKFKTICLQNKTCILDDGATKVFFNAKAATSEKDIEIRSILDYLLNGKSCDTFTNRLETLVAKLKDNEKFRSEYMAEAL